MTKEKYKEKMCKNCIHYDKKCSEQIDCCAENDVIKTWCDNYINIFECAQKHCNECNKYEKCNFRKED